MCHNLYQTMNNKLLSIDIYCLVHWFKENTVTVVRTSSIVGGASVGDQCDVKIGQKVYSDAKILAIGKCI